MNASVKIELSVAPEEKHFAQMRDAAEALTDNPESVQVTHSPESPKKICACFSMPHARQGDVVDRIGRQFWQVDNYNDSSIGFPPDARPKRRTIRPTE